MILKTLEPNFLIQTTAGDYHTAGIGNSNLQKYLLGSYRPLALLEMQLPKTDELHGVDTAGMNHVSTRRLEWC